MNSKQRANLKALAGKIEPIFQIGKGGVSENQLSGISDALNKRELIKISVLRACEQTAAELCGYLAEKLGAEPVAAIGNRIILYRRSETVKEHIEF